MSLKDEARILSLENQVRDMSERLEHIEAAISRLTMPKMVPTSVASPAMQDDTSQWLAKRFRKKEYSDPTNY